MKKRKQWISISLLFTAVTMIAGCVNNPLGMSDSEWESLTSTQQFEARMLQDTRNEAARVRRAEREAQEAIEQAAEQAQLLESRRNAPYGDVVQCTITDATARFAKDKWRPAQPVSVEVYRDDEELRVSLPRKDRPNTSSQLHMSFDGLSVNVCRLHSRDCDVLVGTEAQFRRGLSKHISVKKTVEGTLFCSFPRRW